MTAPSKKILYQNRNKTQAVQKQTGRQTSCVLLAAISAQRPDDQLATKPPQSKGKSLLVSDQSPFPSPTVHTYNS